jgi:hypothetical protein
MSDGGKAVKLAFEATGIHLHLGVDPVSPDSRRLGLGTEAQELAW